MDKKANEIQQLESLLAAGLVAFDLTRQYVGEDMLPAIEGWSWYDWTQKVERYFND